MNNLHKLNTSGTGFIMSGTLSVMNTSGTKFILPIA